MGWLEQLAEEKIRRARAAGAWDAPSPYHGRRVSLEPDNPHLPREWWAAFHILRTHDLLPGWLQRGQWIRAARRAWRQALRAALRRHPASSPARAAALAHLRAQAEELNAHIRDYNLARPWGSAPLAPLVWEEELTAARAAVGEEARP